MKVLKTDFVLSILLIVSAIVVVPACDSNELFSDSENSTGWVFVHDKANILGKENLKTLEKTLSEHNAEKRGKISVLTISELPSGITIERYAAELMEAYTIADKRRQDHILVIIAVRNKKVRIETEKNISMDLTDKFASDIINNIVIPKFKKGDFYGGINAGISEIINKLKAD